MEDHANALAKATASLALAEVIGDRQAICDSRLILAEAYLERRRRKVLAPTRRN